MIKFFYQGFRVGEILYRKMKKTQRFLNSDRLLKAKNKPQIWLFRSKITKFFLWTVTALLFWLLAFSWNSQHLLSTNNSSLNFNLPLSTRGSQIIDAAGQPVLLRGVNWFGIETEIHAPHGLWSRDYREMLTQIKSLGYNIIRLPYSVESLRAEKVSGIDYKIGTNKNLEGKTPLEVMDLIIQEAQRQGILILLDSHRLNSQRIPELWYGDGFTEADWIDTWKMLATRYKNQVNVIGADLKNEPHGKASWGTNDLATDWRLAAQRAGNAILSINPNWLIVVEGVEKNVPGQKLAVHWQGGNLEGVRRFPVRLSVPQKLVYSPHEYGPGVFNQTWFSEPNFPQNLEQRWEIGFNYIARERIAPVWIGEFGGRQVDETSKEGIWQRLLVNYIDNQQLGFAYWSWNPNSADTGGILLDDWLNIDIPKQKLLSQILPLGNFIPDDTPTPTPTPTLAPTSPIIPRPKPSPSPQPSPDVSYNLPARSSANLRAQTIVQSDWQTGFCVTMRVTNPNNTSIANWRLGFTMNQAAINNSWNGIFVPKGSQYEVIPPDWAKVIQPNQTVDMGFCANKLGRDYRPSGVTVFDTSTNQP
jgi:endoglucanase